MRSTLQFLAALAVGYCVDHTPQGIVLGLFAIGAFTISAHMKPT